MPWLGGRWGRREVSPSQLINCLCDSSKGVGFGADPVQILGFSLLRHAHLGKAPSQSRFSWFKTGGDEPLPHEVTMMTGGDECQADSME